MCYCFAVSGDKSAECRPMRPGDPESAKGKAPRRAARGRAAARPGHESGSTQKHKNEVGSSSHRSNLCDPCARVSPCVPCLSPPRVRGGFLSFLGGVSYRIRILMYFDVSCMYPACILHVS